MPTRSTSSPITTSAVKEKRRPPLTTLATRLISTTRSFNSRLSYSRTSLKIGPHSKFQSSLARAIGERLDPAVVEVAAAVEHAALDPGLLRVRGEQLAHLGRLLGLVALEGLLQVE